MSTITATPDELRTEAANLDRAAQESFEKYDTDSFLTQWSNGVSATLKRAQADLAEDGDVAEFPALFDLEGAVISTHLVHGQYGSSFLLTDEAEERLGTRFISPSKAQKDEVRRANNRKKGVTAGTIRTRAYAHTTGGGTGLGGTTSVRVTVSPVVEALKAGDYTIVTTER